MKGKYNLINYGLINLPARKAPGPDGFTAEFLRACWGIIKTDIVQTFDQLYALRGRGFHKLNQALLTLLPKKPDASMMSEYRPISLIHLVAKLFAKTLSLRLTPKLDTLVSKNQNAFISGRSLHDNFVLVRQSARLLHQLREPRVLLKLDLAAPSTPSHGPSSSRCCAGTASPTDSWTGSPSSSARQAPGCSSMVNLALPYGTAAA
jgi:hypothetical protein